MWVSKKFLTACSSSNCLGGRFVGFHFRGSPREREKERERRSPARKPQLAGVVAGTLVALSTRKKSATWKLGSTKAVCFLCRVLLQLVAEFLLCMYPHLNNSLTVEARLFIFVSFFQATTLLLKTGVFWKKKKNIIIILLVSLCGCFNCRGSAPHQLLQRRLMSLSSSCCWGS